MMDTVAFNERIMRTVWDKCKPASVLMVIALVLLGIDIVYLFVTKSNAGFAVLNILPIRHVFKNRFSTKSQIALHSIVAVILISYLVGTIVPAYRDVHNGQYCYITAQYTHEEHKEKGTLFSNGYVWIETQVDGFYLELPVDWDEYEFPFGTYYGIICYGEESRILTSFICQPALE